MSLLLLTSIHYGPPFCFSLDAEWSSTALAKHFDRITGELIPVLDLHYFLPTFSEQQFIYMWDSPHLKHLFSGLDGLCSTSLAIASSLASSAGSMGRFSSRSERAVLHWKEVRWQVVCHRLLKKTGIVQSAGCVILTRKNTDLNRHRHERDLSDSQTKQP